MGLKKGVIKLKVTTNIPIPQEEIDQYIKRAEELHPGTSALDLYIDGDYVNIVYHVMPFDRIRRITGYLVGTLDRWNDAKRAEEHDRVKHGVIE